MDRPSHYFFFFLDLWKEIGVKWPRSYWDDWMREPAQRKERACIRPEISRTKTFGKIGVSNGLFYEKHLKYIVLNNKFVPFTVLDLSYLLKEKYDERLEYFYFDTSVLRYLPLLVFDLKCPIFITTNRYFYPFYTFLYYYFESIYDNDDII